MQLTDVVSGLIAELRGAAAPPVRLEDELERDLGIDSLARSELALRIEQAFRVRLPEDALLDARTVRDLAAALAAAAPRLAPALTIEAPAVDALNEHPQQAGTLLAVLDWHAAQFSRMRAWRRRCSSICVQRNGGYIGAGTPPAASTPRKTGKYAGPVGSMMATGWPRSSPRCRRPPATARARAASSP